MRNVWLLLKNYLLCGIGNLRRKNSRAKTAVGIAAVVVFYGAFFAFIMWYMLTLAKFSTAPMPELPDDMAGAGTPAGGTVDSVLAMGLIVSIFLAVIFALQKITGGQKANDTELLLSMPFKKIEIMVAKALSRFAFNLALVALFFLPSMIAYLIYAPFSLTAIFGCLVIMLLIPLMAVGLSYLVDFLVTVCFSNSKFGNISKAIFTLITLVGVVGIYEFLVFNLEDGAVMSHVVDWMVTFNPLIMLPLIVGVVSIFILGNWLNALLLNRESRAAQAKPTRISAKTTTPFRSLLKNESNRYFNSPTLMINTLIGPLAMLALTIWLAIDQGKMLASILPLQALGIQPEMIYLFIGLTFAIGAVMTYPSAISISQEGKQLWILRSMPIHAATVLTAKVLFNVILVVPVTLLCGIVLQISLKISFGHFIVMMIIPLLTSVLVSYTGVFINLCFPKLEYENEHSLIKQSLSAIIMLFGGMLIILGLGALTFWLIFKISFAALAAILIGILLIVTGVVITLTYTVGQRIFNRL